MDILRCYPFYLAEALHVDGIVIWLEIIGAGLFSEHIDL